MNAEVRVEQISKIYRQGELEVHALRDVSLEISGESFLSVSGPSGSGKTTLLNLIGGLDTPTAGRVFVAGKRVDQLSSAELAELRLRNVGFVFQAYNLIPVLTAQKNVSFVMQLQGVPAAERSERSRAILAEVGLAGREGRKIHVRADLDTLHPGMIQVQIQDNGSGMDEDTLKKIFNFRFTTKPEGKGSGLGLYISKYIIELHGGMITAESREGEGSTFLIRLPIYQEKAEKISLASVS